MFNSSKIPGTLLLPYYVVQSGGGRTVAHRPHRYKSKQFVAFVSPAIASRAQLMWTLQQPGGVRRGGAHFLPAPGSDRC